MYKYKKEISQAEKKGRNQSQEEKTKRKLK